MAKKKCKGGICKVGNKVVSVSPQAQARLNPVQRPVIQPQLPVQQQPSIQQSLNGLQPINPGTIPTNIGQGIPQQYNPQANFRGPLQGLAALNPYQQQISANVPPNSSLQIPVPTAQNTAIPQGQVLHRKGKQRGKIGRAIVGSRPEVFNNPNFTPFQTEALNYLLQYGLAGLQDLDENQFDFTPIGNQELERFYTQTIPSLAERFTALGNGQRSSAFQGALANAGRFLSNDLAAQQQQYNLQQQGQEQNLITNLLSMGLSPQFSSNLNPGSGGLLGGIVKGATAIGKALV